MAGRAVIGAKVRAPEVRALTRERLHDLLGGLWTHRLGLVVAPAGSGKTTLLAQFAASCEVPVAWYRAEASDATEEVFLAHIQRSAADRFSGLEGGWAAVEDMVQAIDAWGGRGGLIVIDEIDALWGTAAEASVERLAEYLPQGWAVLCSGRRPPGFNLSRLRVNGHLLEIGPEDLRFRFWEVERLFRDFYGEPLPPDQLAELTRRTEGWAAGLQLFHLATRGQPARQRGLVLTELGRRSRLMREYLAANVIDQLPDDLRSFLVETCVLGRLTAPLCDAVTGRSDSARVLAELEQARLFTHRTDHASFRYHEVLRSHLEASLVESVGDGGVRERFRASGQLLEADGALPDALRAYSRAEDFDAVLRLLGGRGAEAVDATGDWIDLLPSALVDQDPWLLLGSARRYVSTGRWSSALDAYHRAERLFGPGHSAALCRRERTALSAWLEPVATPGPDWTGRLRAAVRRQPLAAVSPAAAASALPADRFAHAVGLLLAGHVRDAAAVAASLDAEPGLSPVLSVAVDVVATVAAMLGGSPVVIELDRIGERADALGIPWLASLARGLIRGGPGTSASPEKGDPWAPALVSLLGGLRALLAGGRPTASLDETADELRRLGAPVLESWARSVAALTAARAGRPGSVMAARDAEVRARSADVPGSLAVALAALAVAEPEHEVAHLGAARALGDTTGIDVWRLVGPRRGVPTGGGRSPVVGRERERAELHAYVDGLASGRGRTVLLSGPSGIGKTRLAEDTAEHARSQGVSVLWGQAAAGSGPHWVWGQMLRSHLMTHDLIEESPRPEAVPALSRLVPELPELLPHVALEVDREVSQQEVFDEVSSFFAALSGAAPLLLVVDDLHRLDATSLHLFDFLARSLLPHRVMLLGTHQGSGSTLNNLTAASRVRLGGLAPSAITALVADVAREEPSQALAASLAELTEGNPFFVMEMARMLAVERPGRIGELGRADLRLPPSLRELALGRLDALSVDTRSLLEVAAVIGRTFSVAVLEVAAGLSPSAVLTAIGEARDAGLVDDDGPAPGVYRFTHGLLHEALYEAQAPVERSRRHNLVGEAIEAISAPLIEPRVNELAHHLLLGASTGDRARAAAYARRAAAQALEHAAYEDARSWATRALEALGDLRGHTELRRRLLDLGAQAEAAVGDEERAAGLRAAAASLVPEPGDPGAVDRSDHPVPGPGSAVAVRCFGSFAVRLEGSELDVSGLKPRVRSLLRFLALRAGEAVHREQLVDALWPDADLRTGMRSLQTAVSALRQHLEPGVARGGASMLVREGDAYRLVLPAGTTTDVQAFEHLAQEASVASSAGAVGSVTEALALYRGDLLEEEGPADWVVADRERLRLRAGEAAEIGARAAMADGDAETAVRLVEAGVDADRYRDGLWRLLIEAHQARGDRAAAARAARQYDDVLAELGVDPQG